MRGGGRVVGMEGSVKGLLMAGWSKEDGGERWPAGVLEGGRLMPVGAILASRSGVVVLRRRRAGVVGGA